MAEIVPVLLRVMATSVSAAVKAGHIIRDVLRKGDLGIVQKGANDPQTEADRAAQRCIVHNLSSKFSDLEIIAEEDIPKSETIPTEWMVREDSSILSLTCPEAYKNLSEKDILVFVDPLDGTREYTQGFLDHVTVLIGLVVNDKPVCGIIHQPFYKDGDTVTGRTIWGMKEVGIGGFELRTPDPNMFVLTVTRSHSDQILESAIGLLKPDNVLRVGGAGHKVLLVLEGKAHAYIYASPGLRRWDTCATEAILEAVGGKLTDIYGRHYVYNSSVNSLNVNGVIAAINERYHQLCRSVFPNEPSDI